PESAASAAAALDLVASGAGFDVAVLDMEMPDVDGVQLAAQLRERCPDLPIIVLSSLGRRIDAPTDLVQVALTKPVKQAQLCSTLATVLRDAATRNGARRKPAKAPAPSVSFPPAQGDGATEGFDAVATERPVAARPDDGTPTSLRILV